MREGLAIHMGAKWIFKDTTAKCWSTDQVLTRVMLTSCQVKVVSWLLLMVRLYPTAYPPFCCWGAHRDQYLTDLLQILKRQAMKMWAKIIPRFIRLWHACSMFTKHLLKRGVTSCCFGSTLICQLSISAAVRWGGRRGDRKRRHRRHCSATEIEWKSQQPSRAQFLKHLKFKWMDV